MTFKRASIAAAVVTLVFGSSAMAQEKTLRLLTWADYAPAAVVAQFEKETGYKVELTLSNNEEMISKLRATGGAGFDLAQPSQDRIAGPQALLLIAVLIGVCVPLFNVAAVWPMARHGQRGFWRELARNPR